jgi:hypothetical protein
MAKVRGIQLSNPQLKSLLQDAEDANLLRRDLDLQKLLNKKPDIYKHKGNPIRTAFRHKWCQVRDIKIEHHRALP